MVDLHALLTEHKALVHVSSTGSGPRLLRALWDMPGSSQYLVGFEMPYSRTQQEAFLGHEVEGSYISEEVAYDMAMESYMRAAEYKLLESAEGDPVGVGITAAVASARMPRGDQRAHIVVISKHTVLYRKILLEKAVGVESRIEHDGTVTYTVARMLKEALDPQGGRDSWACTAEAQRRFFLYPYFDPSGLRRESTAGTFNGVYFPATLNPIHDGHRYMARCAEFSTGMMQARTTYLINTKSPHKGSLSLQEILTRAAMLRAERWNGNERPFEFTEDEPLFVDKVARRPRSHFVLGIDALLTLLDRKWGSDPDTTLSAFAEAKATLWVMGRQVDGKWMTLDDLQIPFYAGLDLQSLEGRKDISSTQIRESQCTPTSSQK